MLPTQHDALLSVDQTVMALERLIAPPYPESDEFYGWEALPLPMFFAGMEAVGPPGPRSFLEVGCGIGTKMHVARMLGWNHIAGIEPHAPYLDVARRLCPWAELCLDHAAAFEDYHLFDVVYMYRPHIDDDKEAALERLIVSRMKSGSYAFFPQGIGRDLGELVATDVWRVS